MPLPAIDHWQRATYPSLRDVIAVLEAPEPPALAPSSRPLGENLGKQIVACLRTSTEPLTCLDIAERVRADSANVNNWIKQMGWRHGITCTGTVKRRVGVRPEKLYEIRAGVVGLAPPRRK